MLIVSTAGVSNINDQHHSTNGVFDVDPDTAQHLLCFPGWRHALEDETPVVKRGPGRPRKT
jgi:hypothetical protein